MTNELYDDLVTIKSDNARLRQELGRLHKDLERRNAEVTTLADRLTRADDELGQFAHMAAHDLQEPLRIMAMYVELLQHHADKEPDPETNEMYDALRLCAAQGTELVSRLLEFSEVGFKPVDIRSFGVDHALQPILMPLRPAIEKQGGEIVCDPLPQDLCADEFQIKQLFQNLIGNAIKYCSERPLRIRISARREDSAWLFSVEDNGIGIEESFWDTIYEPFQRVDKGKETSGLGLSICRKIVERHGGRIWVESEPGKGSVFRFTIPDAAENKTQPTSA